MDKADVDEFVELHLKNFDPKLTPETRADLAEQFALNYSKLKGMSPAWAKELARKVHQRALWLTKETGGQE